MLFRLFFGVLYLLTIAFIESVNAQSYVADTIISKISSDSVYCFNKILYVDDSREESANFVSIYEKKKLVFFPVDQIVLLDRPLAEGFEYHLNSTKGDAYHLDIHEFYIDNTKSLFKRSLNLNGAFQLSKIQASGDTSIMGAFYYENSAKFKKKKEIDLAYSEVISNFKSELCRDLNVVCADSFNTNDPAKNHFHSGSLVAPKSFYISSDIYYGYTFWGFDAEIYFSSPEPAQKFSRKSRMFRFLQYENRQSVAFAPKVYYWNYRITDKWLFQNKSAFLVGFNKWDDVDEESRTLEELLLFQYSMMQHITLNNIDKSGLVFGIGLIEEFSYVIYNKPMFNVGLVLHFAYKF